MNRRIQEVVDTFEAFAVAVKLMKQSPNIEVLIDDRKVSLQTWYIFVTANGNKIMLGPYTRVWVEVNNNGMIFYIDTDDLKNAHPICTAEDIMNCFEKYLEVLIEYIY